jgi:hypothetical protein
VSKKKEEWLTDEPLFHSRYDLLQVISNDYLWGGQPFQRENDFHVAAKFIQVTIDNSVECGMCRKQLDYFRRLVRRRPQQ